MRPSASTTSRAVIFCDSMTSRARVASSRRPMSTGLPGHALGGGAVEQAVAVALHLAAQVAVGDDAQEAAVGLGHRGQPQALARHLEEHVLHRGRGAHARDLVALVHEVLHAQELPAELAARVEHGEVVDGEAAPLHEGHGQGVAHGQGGGGGGGGGQAQGAGLVADGDVEVDVGGLGQGRARVAGQGHEGRAEALDLGEQGQDLLRLAAVAEGEDDVALDDAPEVAVDGVGGVQVERGRARWRRGWPRSSGR